MNKRKFDSTAYANCANMLYAEALQFLFRFTDEKRTAEILAERSLADAQKQLPVSSKRAFRKIIKNVILKNCAEFEDSSDTNSPSSVQGAYAKYQSGRKRKQRFLAVTAVALAAVIVVAILCATLIPAALKRNDTNEGDFSGSGISGRTPFLIGEMYIGSDKSVTFIGISAHNSLTVDDETYEGYYLVASAVIDDDNFLLNTLYPSNRFARLLYYRNGELLSPPSDDLPINADLTKKCSTTEVSICDWNSNPSDPQPIPYSQTHGIVNFVYDLSQEQYEYLYESREIHNDDREAMHQGEISIYLPNCTLSSSPGFFNSAYFTFFYHEINFEEELQ